MLDVLCAVEAVVDPLGNWKYIKVESKYEISLLPSPLFCLIFILVTWSEGGV